MNKDELILIGFLSEMWLFIFAGFSFHYSIFLYLIHGIYGVIIAGIVGNLISDNAIEKYKRRVKCKFQ